MSSQRKILICACTLLLVAYGSFNGFAQIKWIYPEGCNSVITYYKQWTSLDSVLPLASGWVKDLTLSDEFNTNWVDTLKWYVVSGCHPMSSKSTFQKNQYTFSADGQHLRLKVIRLPQPMQCPDDTTGKLVDFESGYITASHDVRYGYFGIRMKYPCNVNLNPCFWFKGSQSDTVQGYEVITKYDEIDGLEYLDVNASLHLLRNSVIHGNNQIPGTNFLPGQLECKEIRDSLSFCHDTVEFGLEWLPSEINFYINGECVSGFKHSDDPSLLVLNNQQHSPFTCVHMENMIKQLMMISLSVNKHNPDTYDSIEDGQGLAVDWIRSYKLLDANETTYFWPSIVTLTDPNLTKVHQEIILGGDTTNPGHSGVIPISPNLTFWSKTNISLGSTFTVQPGSNVTFRCIATKDELFQSNLQSEE